MTTYHPPAGARAPAGARHGDRYASSAELSRPLVDLLRNRLPEAAEQIADEVRAAVPEYARPGDHAYRANLRLGVEQALALFVDLMDASPHGGEAITGTFREIGRGEALEGRSLDALQSALRVGGRAAWRLLAREAEQAGLGAAVPAALADAAFTAIHEVAEAAAAGHAEARRSGGGEVGRLRRRLLDLLLREPAGPAEAVAELAGLAGWSVPVRVAVVVLGPQADWTGRRLLLPDGVLADLRSVPALLLVPEDEVPGSGPDAPGAAAVLPALRGRAAAIGPAVPLAEAPDSRRWAERALHLMRRGVLPAGGPLRCADHLPTLLLYADEPLQRALVREALAPLAGVPGAQRERLAETLLVWLRSGRSVPAVAARLHVHPQTVRYRLRRLEGLFGDRLRDPDRHFELELALHAASRAQVGRADPYRGRG